MAVATVFGTPLHWIASNCARRPLLAAIRNVVAVEVRQRAIAALAVVDDAVVVAVGGPFDDRPSNIRGRILIAIVVPLFRNVCRGVGDYESPRRT